MPPAAAKALVWTKAPQFSNVPENVPSLYVNVPVFTSRSWNAPPSWVSTP